MDGSFDAFVGANLDGLLRTAYLITWDEREAEDLVQECLIKVARRWSRVGTMQHPLAYARRVLVNLATDDAKGRFRRRAELDTAVVGADRQRRSVGVEAPELARLETRSQLVAALAELAPRQRAVLVLRYFLDVSEANTAQALGCSVGTVKNTGAKALVRLRESLGREQPLPEVCNYE